MPDLDPWALHLPNLRSLFLPDEGHAFVEADLARADAQVIAWEAGAKELKHQLQADEDIHSDNAQMLYGSQFVNGYQLRKIRDIPVRAMHTNGMSFRDNGKRFVHSTNFYGSYRNLAALCVVLEDHMKKAQHWWCHVKHPEIGELHRRLDRDLRSRKNPFVRNAFGFRRQYVGGEGVNYNELLRQALAWIAQCVPLDHEVLTHQGWKQIADVSSKEEIAIWHPNGTISFEVPSHWNYGKAKELLYLDGVHCAVTENHRVPYYNAGRPELQVQVAQRLPKGARIPRTGLFSGDVTWNANYARYVVAFQADGHYDVRRDSVTFEFRRERKIERMQLLLDALDIPHTRSQVRRDSTVFYIPKGKHKLDGAYKKYDAWLLALSGETLDVILNELHHWDGSLDKNGITFYEQAIESSVEWIATIAHLRGKRARWYNEDKARITIAPNKGLRSATGRLRLHGDFDVACPTVSTGFFMIRNAKEISVTGNSTVAGVINKATLAVDCGRDIFGEPRCGHCLICEIPEVQSLTLQIHDSILLQLPLEMLTQAFVERFQQAMRVVVPYPDPLIIGTEVKWSAENWGKMRKWTGSTEDAIAA